MTLTAPPEPALLSPVALVCARAGGYRRLAEWIDVPHSTTWRWLNPVKRRTRKKATGGKFLLGQVPTQYQRQIMEAFRKRGVRLTATELLDGGRL